MVYHLEKNHSKLLIVGTKHTADYSTVMWWQNLLDEVKLLSPTSAIFESCLMQFMALDPRSSSMIDFALWKQMKQDKVAIDYFEGPDTCIEQAIRDLKNLGGAPMSQEGEQEAHKLISKAYLLGSSGADVVDAYKTLIKGTEGQQLKNHQWADKILNESPARGLIVVGAAHLFVDVSADKLQGTPDKPSLITLLQRGGYKVTKVGVRGIGPLEPGSL